MVKLAPLFILLLAVGAFASDLTIWPAPKSIHSSSGKTVLDPNHLSISLTNSQQSTVVKAAITNFFKTAFPWKTSNGSSTLTSIELSIESVDENLQLGVEESYQLSLTSAPALRLKSNSIWGALHGLTTLSQMIIYDESSAEYFIPASSVAISDEPRFIWRGLLVDTSRHYQSMDALKHTIELLAFNKMNTLHLHAVDAQSFPFEIKSYPDLSAKGAYGPNAVYTQTMMKELIEFGREHGVRVMVETDIPGHAASWEKGVPGVVTNCPGFAHNINNLNLDPSCNKTFPVIEAVISELAAVFPDNYFHIGGDELVLGCWRESAAVSHFMKEKGIATYRELEQYFNDFARKVVLASQKQVVVWEEALKDGLALPANVVVHVWSDPSQVKNAASKGHPTLRSAGWYLDKQDPTGQCDRYLWGDTWMDFYGVDPVEGLNDAEANLVLGGEAAMWTEQVESDNLIARVWPRASAVAERLWSPEAATAKATAALPRLITHRCSMKQRFGLPVMPIRPDYCPYPN
eukprot:GCRY01000259.1.p1 GENE.GCRY01000259.1~~GCRY01000259.1.p1  ORF type:complete len:518 (-),score=131.67 GCRY01000259.1:530-2083(-)